MPMPDIAKNGSKGDPGDKGSEGDKGAKGEGTSLGELGTTAVYRLSP